MKITKKMLALFLATVIVLSAISVFANDAEITERKTYEVETVSLGDYFKSESDWKIMQDGDLEFKNGKIVNNSNKTIVFSYAEDGFSNSLVQYNVKFNYTNSEGGATWSGLALRSGTPNEYSWGSYTDQYLFVIKSDRIELQRWNSTSRIALDVVPNDYIKEGVETNISVGAVNTDLGVCIFLFVDDQCIINVCDADKAAITEGKYFNLYSSQGSEVSKYTGGEIPSVPTMPVVTTVEGDEYKFSADYSLVSFGGEAKDEYKITWYHSVQRAGTELTEIDESAMKEFSNAYDCVGVYPDYLGEGAEIVAEYEYATDFYRACVEDEEGIVTGGYPVFVEEEPFLASNAGKILNSSVVLRVDYENSLVNGEKIQIDANDVNVMPTVIDGRTLVPVRFVAESFGATVGWDEATSEVKIELGEDTILMTLDKTAYTVNGEAKELDVPARTMYDRTMVPVRAISEAFGKVVFWDEENELIVISDEDLGLDSEKDADVLYYIAKEIR